MSSPQGGPLTAEELGELESTLLPALERHHLRLLAHGLRTFQEIAGRRSGPLPGAAALQHWLAQQAAIANEPSFREALAQQLQAVAAQLQAIAAGQACEPLALELAMLCRWAVEQADQRLANITPPKESP